MALTSEIMDRYSPHAVRIEALQRQVWRHGLLKNKFVGDISPRCEFLLSLCFNPSSMANAEAEGMDAGLFRQEVVDWLRPRLARLPTEEDTLPVDKQWIAEAFDGQLSRYMGISRKNTTALWQRVAEVIRRGGGKVQSDYLAHSDRTWSNDLDPSINKSIERLTTSISGTGEQAKKELQDLLSQMAPNAEAYVPVGPGNVTSAAPLIEKVKAVADAGAKGALFYNYGLLREAQLGFVGDALRSLSVA